ncbi:MAG: glycosyltransferase family 39 protein [Gemmatimonadota bacterium]
MSTPPRRTAQRRAGPHPARQRPGPPQEADTVLFPSLPEPRLADRRRPPAPPDPDHQPRPAAPAPAAPAPRRRTWISRGVLAAILVMQALLSLRMQNTAFEDEALYLYAGHMELGHFLSGYALQGNYPSYFSGAPVLYPVLGAVADSLGGLAGARAVSLAAALAATALLYALTRRLFNERVGLCAALIFSVTESALVLGHLATYDASALFLLALAAWIVVRSAASWLPLYLLAAPVLALAVAGKYASLLFVPTVVGLTALAGWPYRGWQALIRPVVLAAVTGELLIWALHQAGKVYLTGIEFTTTSRAHGSTPATALALDCVKWGGLPFALAVVGAVAYARRPENEAGEQIAPAGGRWRRSLLGLALTGTALLAPAEQLRLHTETSLYKHIGFGLLFAAPLAGVGLARIVGDHFRRAQLGIAIWGAALVLGMVQAHELFSSWPDSSLYVQEFSRYLRPGAHYLAEVDEVPIYYLRLNPAAQPYQFSSTYFLGYTTPQGRYLTGTAAYRAAIRDGYFRVISYNYQVTPALDAVIARTLQSDPRYRLAAAIPNRNGTSAGADYVWVRR